MSSQIIKREGNKITLQLEVELDPTSMLKSEEQIQQAINEAANLVTGEALEQFDTDGRPIEVEGKVHTSKGKKKNYQTPYGKITVFRHVYQSSQGGHTYCPLETGGRVIHDSTPKFAKMVSSKHSDLGSRKVQRDLKDNHGRPVSRSYIQDMSQAIGQIILGKELHWQYALPSKVKQEAATVSIGRDGTTMYLSADGYRETMSGTISFYDKQGERLHTIYVAQTPE